MKFSIKQNGMSLIELLVVISIFALLIGILLPSLSSARQQAIRSICLNNLKQMVTAAEAYCISNDSYYPIAYDLKIVDDIRIFQAWDFSTWKDWRGDEPVEHVEPGLLWMGQAIEKVQQCPVYKGPANWLSDPYTGYNYNTSYIGRNETIKPVNSAKSIEVHSPGLTVIFGDGEYTEGANKFMRAPLSNPRDISFSDSDRYAGAQGFRHMKTTNAAFCDGHADFQRTIYTHTDPVGRDILEQHNSTEKNLIGFLSKDNRLYDLK